MLKETFGLKKNAVLCVIKNINTGKILILRRTKEPHFGKCIPIGGKLKPCETPNQAVVRECEEETGLKLKDCKMRGMMIETSPIDFNWTNFIYYAEVKDKNLKECKEGELIWIEKEELNEINMPDSDKFLYKYVFESDAFFVLDVVYDENIKIQSLTELIEGKTYEG